MMSVPLGAKNSSRKGIERPRQTTTSEIPKAVLKSQKIFSPAAKTSLCDTPAIRANHNAFIACFGVNVMYPCFCRPRTRRRFRTGMIQAKVGNSRLNEPQGRPASTAQIERDPQPGFRRTGTRQSKERPYNSPQNRPGGGTGRRTTLRW